jgi:NAD(P) transhydrogenase subunit alpha
MRLAVLNERLGGETRVAGTPETVRKLVALGLSVAVEAGAGSGTSIPDAEYSAAGAEIAADAAAALAGAGVVFAVQVPGPAAFAAIPRGALLVCISGAMADRAMVPRFAQAGVDVAAMELLPRITRAQSMDILSSQANLAGYRAVIEGAAAFDRGFPMMMTAAGTVPPARVFVVGAGVAGLQAIATARRLGAIVSATDVRPAAKEEIKSLGASFVGVEDSETAGQTGAYAREMSAEFRQKQAELMAATVAKNDMVICTALVQGGRAPVLVTQAMVDAMRPGSVVVDIAADGGGNCEATRPGEAYVTDKGVKILGYRNWPGRISVAASTLYAKNLLTFLTTFWDKAAGAPRLPEDDAIIKGVMLTRGGAVVHAQFAPEAAAPAAPEPAAHSAVPEPETDAPAAPAHRETASIEPEAAAPDGPAAPADAAGIEAAPAVPSDSAETAGDAGEIALPATPIAASAPQPDPELGAEAADSAAGATSEPVRAGGGAKKKTTRAKAPAGGKSPPPRAGES